MRTISLGAGFGAGLDEAERGAPGTDGRTKVADALHRHCLRYAWYRS